MRKLKLGMILKFAILFLVLILLAILVEKCLNFGGPELPSTPPVRAIGRHIPTFLDNRILPL
jgi:hypothetical protein